MGRPTRQDLEEDNSRLLEALEQAADIISDAIAGDDEEGPEDGE